MQTVNFQNKISDIIILYISVTETNKKLTRYLGFFILNV